MKVHGAIPNRFRFAALAILGFAAVTARGADHAARFDGPVHTDGRAIRDRSGREVILAGVNSSGMEWGAGEPWTDGHCEGLRDDRHLGCYAVENAPGDEEWRQIDSSGFNSIRLPIAWANLEPEPPTLRGRAVEHHWNEDYLRALDGIVEACQRHHLAVILSMHQWAWSPALRPEGKNANLTGHGNGFPAWLYRKNTNQIEARREFFKNARMVLPGYSIQEALADAWTRVASRYRGRICVVGADLLNEPYLAMEGEPKADRIPLDDLFERLGQSVHRANSELLLIVQDDPPATPITRCPALPNLVYSIHLYPKKWDARAAAKLTASVARGAKWNAPLWVGEFDMIGGGNAQETEAMLKAFRENRVLWAYWAYSRASKPLRDGARLRTDRVQVLQQGF
jgi:Cellulase (glycosyl hydrolase family 5)